MKKKSLYKVYSVIILGVLSAGNIMFVQSDVWNSKAGTPVELAAADMETYGVEGVSVLKDGTYLVTSRATGYNSEDPLQVTVIFDAAGAVIQQVEVTYHAETDGIGSKVADESFLGQFAGAAAPVGLAGQEISVISPGTGAVWGAEEGAAAEPAAGQKTDNRSNPDRWNPDDQSPEAVAMRNLYRSGLLASAYEQEPLRTPIADASAEEKAAYRLEESGLSTSENGAYSPNRGYSAEDVAAGKLAGAGLTAETEDGPSPARDGSPEGAAAARLEQAGLTVAADPAVDAAEPAAVTAASSGGLNELDAVSGATVSSTAVVQAVDQAYFVLQEQILD